MKKFIIFCGAGLILLSSLSAGVKDDAYSSSLLTNSKKLGLVSYLTTLKTLSEYKVICETADTSSHEDELKTVYAQYYQLKLLTDALINQLSADMVTRNKLRVYKKLDKYVKGEIGTFPGRYLQYKDIVDSIFVKQSRLFPADSLKASVIPSLDNVLGMVELAQGITTDIRDFRQGKVNSIIIILKELRFKALKDILEPDKASVKH